MPIDIADVAEVIYYAEDSVAPLTVLKPAAFAAGQLLVMIMGVETGVLADMTAPAGWTQQGSYANVGSASNGKVWTHVYSGADPSTWDFGYNAGSAVAAALVRVTGAESTPTIVVSSQNNGPTGGTIDSPTLTPTGMNDLLLVALGCTGGGTALLETDPTDTNNLGQVQVTGNFMALAVASKQLTNGSAIGAQSWTAITPANHAGGTFSIAILSTGFLDPDPPLRPPAAEIPPWLLDELLAWKSQEFVGDNGVPRVQEYVASSAANAAASVTSAATTKAGDLLVFFHGNDFYTAAGLVAPTGTAGTWTLQATGDGGTNGAHLKVWTRFVTVDGAQTVNFTKAVDEEHTGQLLVITGADQVSPVDGAAGGSGAASTSQVAPTVTPASLNCLLLSGVQSGFSGSGDYTAPSTMFKVGEIDQSTTTTGTVAKEVLGNTNATGTRTFSTTRNDIYASVSIAITPLATGAATINGTATVTGAGTLTNPATQGSGATLTGAGALAAAGATAVFGTASLIGAGALTSPATQGVIGSAVGAGTLSSAVIHNGSASATGAGVLSGPVVQGAFASPTGAGALSSPATQNAAASPTGVGVLTAATASTSNGVAAPTGAGALSSPATQGVIASLAGAGTLSAPVVQNGSATCTGAGALSAPAVQRSGASPTGAGTLSSPVVQQAVLTGTGAGTLSALAVQAATSALTGAGVLSATGTASGGANATLTGSGTLAAVVTQGVIASLVGAGTLSAPATQGTKATPTGAGTLTTAGVIAGTVTLAGAGVCSSGVRQSVTAPLVGAGALAATPGTGAAVGVASLVGAGSLAATPHTRITPRPVTTTTARPSSGTTVRPGSGTTTRPSSGITTRPYTGITVDPI